MHIPLWRRILTWVVVAAGVLAAVPNAFYATVEQSNDAKSQIESGVSDDALRAQAAGWPAWLPSSIVSLGLDLRGGAHLLAEVQLSQVYAERVDAMWPQVRDLLAAQRDTLGFVQRIEGGDPSALRVRISNADQAGRAVDLIRTLAQPVQTLTGIGATDLDVRADNGVISITLSEAERAATDERAMRQSLEIIRRRIDEVGTREPTIIRQGEDRILVQVPGVGSAQEVKDLIGATARLTFQHVVSSTNDPNAQVTPDQEVLPALDQPGVYYILDRQEIVSGEQLVDSQPSFDQTGRPVVTFRFNPTGARAFGEHTAQYTGSLFAIVLDGEVISAPQIREPILGGSGSISGTFNIEQTTNLAVLLRAGALPADLVFLEERTIGPELGQDSIDAGVRASIIAGLLVMGYMVLSYGLFFGMIANIALILNVTMMLGLLSIIGATLTLPGIAGIVLTMGVAVDANVLIFERMREEIRRGKAPWRCFELGYDKAMSAIIDSNITSIMIAIILYVIGSGAVRGFAVTLGLGVATSMFTAVFVTRLILLHWFEMRKPKKLEL
ncbi:protein translocase subunit SecD [Ketogulonicigenium vulgare]|uniref:protein translocase subunit SecD n=1 Tax=Ketogulonicigenium vulgare TaxID=92945 RepID=UPI0001E670B4|nr:protein translocase subunit SecD [Ketogulonicigenium vulgare]ADO42503.1 protein-export membrane protein SecD [Ketogulonicigenium vulgare Y25]ALJ80872.1 preprotein translocase subunit SecD [Ketogulonicigenium vulgare]ANW33646.1 protein-export membrane protein SecD [Ketogulonicigenium vulgare]AOZ54417.1 protein-export membrane protein SecD [Ketogulonicigenium vulgare]